jgi:putative heme iron utilization protein
MAAKQEHELFDDARLLIRNAQTGTLATSSAGIPHAAFVTVAFQPDFSPVLLLSQLAIHTRQLQANPACSLLLLGAPAGVNPQTTPRLCLTGTAATTDDPTARTIFLHRHPYAAGYADFGDFAFWQILITDAYYVGGFAAATRLPAAKLPVPD